MKAFAYIERRTKPLRSANCLTKKDMVALAELGVVLLAENNSGLVGCVFLNPKTDVMYLGNLAVDPSRQGDGIMPRLFAVSVEVAKAHWYVEMEVPAQAHVALLENHVTLVAMGFRETGRIAHDGYDQPILVTLRCRL
jgi:N-acetylglutamate synthase-like GNAT family acetyltransferase